MKTTVIKEEPIFSYEGTCPEYGETIEIYIDELKTAEQGHTWICQDQDKYPNAEEYWDVTVTLVYKKEDGCALLINQPHYSDDLYLMWVEFRK